MTGKKSCHTIVKHGRIWYEIAALFKVSILEATNSVAVSLVGGVHVGNADNEEHSTITNVHPKLKIVAKPI